ncbi:hypothetical protein [Mycobacterium sp.]
MGANLLAVFQDTETGDEGLGREASWLASVISTTSPVSSVAVIA